MVAHMAELARLAGTGRVGVEDGLGRPDTNMAVYIGQSA
jgi:hypothetical protein